jgi:hypothetical protein
VFVLYGNAGETLETAFLFNGTAPTVTVVSGAHKPKTGTKNGALALQYTTTGSTVVAVGSSILLYIVGGSPSSSLVSVTLKSHRPSERIRVLDALPVHVRPLRTLRDR